MQYKIRLLIGGTSFVVLFVFYIIGFACVFLSKRPFSRAESLLAASIFIGVPLLHHIWGRANYGHLAQGIHPMLIGLIAVAVSARMNGRKILTVMTTLLFAALTAVPVLFSSEFKMSLLVLEGKVLGKSLFVQNRIYHDTFWLPQTQVNELNRFMQFLRKQMRPDENILIAPYAPGLYCLLHKKSPIWDAYPIHLAPSDEQTRSIRDMETKNVRWAFIDTKAQDQIKEWAFPFTHERIWRYILREFEPVDCPGLSESQILFRKRTKPLQN